MRTLLIFIFACALLPGATVTMEAEAMTRSGPYAGLIASPFAGVSLYGNTDQVSAAVSLADAPGRYRIDVRGASSSSAAASATVLIDGTAAGTVTWSSATPSVAALDAVDIASAGAHALTIRMDGDTGASDAYIDSVSVTRIGSIPAALPAPVPATVGALTSGVYRNLFAESGRPLDQINAKVEAAWQQLFYGSDATQRIYYPSGTDKAYILDTGNNDVRSEGMSYGMMICAQLDKQTEFDRLWRWASTYMRHPSGEGKGYFSWHCSTDGTVLDPNPASDGESYFVTALVFAHGRWGSTGSINYLAEANAIWEAMFNKELPGEFDSTYNLFDPVAKQVRFVPYASSAGFTDPSYHLPAFYEVWRRVDVGRSAFWASCITASRALFHAAADPATGLMPDYSEFTGAPRSEGNHADFRFDAWRCAMNWSVDSAWNAADPWEVEQSNRLLAFFAAKGIAAYGNQWTLGGAQLDSSHSPGLVAMNAVAVLASNQSSAWAHLDRFWDTPVPTGQYRYYDGSLYLLGLLHCSGKFRAWLPGGTGVTSPSTVTLSGLSAIYDGTPKAVTATTSPPGLTVTVTYNGSTSPPTEAGSYSVSGTVSDPVHPGSASSTLVIHKAVAAVTLDALNVVYDGTPKAVTARVSPSGTPVAVTYNGSAQQPSAAGSYAVVATVNMPNIEGSASAALVIAKAPLVVAADTVTGAAGSTLPALTYQLVGLQAGDTVSVVHRAPALTTTATATSTAGTYPVAVSLAGVQADNYALSAHAGSVVLTGPGGSGVGGGSSGGSGGGGCGHGTAVAAMLMFALMLIGYGRLMVACPGDLAPKHGRALTSFRSATSFSGAIKTLLIPW